MSQPSKSELRSYARFSLSVYAETLVIRMPDAPKNFRFDEVRGAHLTKEALEAQKREEKRLSSISPVFVCESQYPKLPTPDFRPKNDPPEAFFPALQAQIGIAKLARELARANAGSTLDANLQMLERFVLHYYAEMQPLTRFPRGREIDRLLIAIIAKQVERREYATIVQSAIAEARKNRFERAKAVREHYRNS